MYRRMQQAPEKERKQYTKHLAAKRRLKRFLRAFNMILILSVVFIPAVRAWAITLFIGMFTINFSSILVGWYFYSAFDRERH